MRDVVAHMAQVIRIDAVRPTVDPLDMRAGTDPVLARVVPAFAAAGPHHVYVYANRCRDRVS